MATALHLRGGYLPFQNLVPILRVWSPQASPKVSIQEACYRGLLTCEQAPSLKHELSRKLVVTLGDCDVTNTTLPDGWYEDFMTQLRLAKIHVRMCLFKTWIGGWTTSHRMQHEQLRLSCIFGCKDTRDTQQHYLVCPQLWHICGERLKVSPPVSILSRLCITDPSLDHLLLLSLSLFSGISLCKVYSQWRPQPREHVQRGKATANCCC